MFRKVVRQGKRFGIWVYDSVFNKPIGVVFMLHCIGPRNSHRLSCIDELRVSTEFLQKQVDQLRPTHDFIQLDELEYRLRHPENKYSKSFAVFTFDDGYRDNFEFGLPFFAKNGIPFSVFLTCDFINNNRPFNFPFLLERIIWHNEKIELPDGKCFDCSDRAKKDLAYRQLKIYVQSFQYEGFEKKFKSAFSSYLTDDMYEDNFLTWQQIHEMQRSELCMFGSHTMTHCVLSKVPIDKLDYELGESKCYLEKMLNCSVDYISYPFGWIGDVNDMVVNKARCFGYRIGFQSYGGKIRQKDKDFLQLSRTMIEENGR